MAVREKALSLDVVRLLIIGAGNRGEIYSRYALDRPKETRLVAVVEKDPIRASRLARAHKLGKEDIFHSVPEKDHTLWKRVDAVVIAVPDKLHAEMVTLVIDRGIKYILLEKPMGTTRRECQQIEEATRQANACVAVCHVLRYTPLNREIKRLIDSGEIGEVLNIQHTEPVGFYHFAHSYVRGNWRRTDESAGSLLTKSCHDVDLIAYFMGDVPGGKVRSVSSFGSRRHFRRESKPVEANESERCISCQYETQCPYSAKKIYLEPFREKGLQGWPVNVIVEAEEITEESILDALQMGPYGRCVYESDNDVCDNQVVHFQFENGSTASFTMVATTEQLCTRQTKVYASRAEVTANSETGEVRIYDFLSRTERKTFPTEAVHGSSMDGHGFADYFLMHAFIQAVLHNDPKRLSSTATESFKTHSLVFDAEESRMRNTREDFSW